MKIATGISVSLTLTYDRLVLFRRNGATLLSFEIRPFNPLGSEWFEGKYEVSEEFFSAFPRSFSGRENILKLVTTTHEEGPVDKNSSEGFLRTIMGQPHEGFKYYTHVLLMTPSGNHEYALGLSSNEEAGDDYGAIKELLDSSWSAEANAEGIFVSRLPCSRKEGSSGAHADTVTIIRSPVYEKLKGLVSGKIQDIG